VALYLHPQYVFMEWCLVKRRDNFTFNFVSSVYIMLIVWSWPIIETTVEA